MYVALLKSDPKQRFQDVRTTTFAVKFNFVEGATALECDLLPVSADLWRMSHDALLRKIESCPPRLQRYFSAVCGKRQVHKTMCFFSRA
eukprot:m.113286 g.113286  ORF g.113286 m.113286 type:complete len:89 (-) comp9419_c0_seq1:565-831(-)